LSVADTSERFLLQPSTLNFLARWPKPAQNGSMKTPPKRWPHNVKQFRIAGLAVSAFDQKTMVTLRQLADRTGETIEHQINRAIVEFVERCHAEGKLAGKLIPFPMRMHVQEARPRKDDSRWRSQRVKDYCPASGKDDAFRQPRQINSQNSRPACIKIVGSSNA